MPLSSKTLSGKVSYVGDEISVASLEKTIATERDRQNVDIGKLKALRTRNEELSRSLQDEIKRLRKFSDYFSRNRLNGSFSANFKEVLSYLPFIGKTFITKRSIEELLKQQYEISSKRVREAADYSDRLKAAEQDLYDEIERLNEKIIQSAKNEELAAQFVLELREASEALSGEMGLQPDHSTAGYRELQRESDRLQEMLSAHSFKLELYSSAEERLARLKENTKQVQRTISSLYSDIRKYVMAASERLDDSLAHIQAIGTAADASVVLLDMKSSLDSLAASMNQTTQFVSETQLYLRENLDTLINDLEIFDEQTRSVIAGNLERSDAIETAQIDAAVQKAQQVQEKRELQAG